MLRKFLTNLTKFAFTLSPTNYGFWKTMIQSFLATNNLIGYVDGTIQCPSPTIEAPTQSSDKYATKTIQPNPNYSAWVSNDAHVQMIIISTISEASFPHIQGTTSRDLWLSLKRAYAPHTSSWEYTLKTQLLKIEVKNHEIALTNLTRGKEYADALANIGESVKEKDVVMLVISGLREEYNGLKQTLFARHILIAFAELHGLLSDHDYMVKKSAPVVPPAQAFTTTTSSLQHDTMQTLQQLAYLLGF
ncbi:hypothetical protein OSB04_020834 [Centaurea solstitialis]|uniref:UBN2_3 domain-containing protein n=1 Tax=Centaurea solstitialis TaxID=347529 RepID=A0AA38T4E3_9ASTR|nr:hypothetical protein OSB04_020834 [Centaurea solstitialis]